ncbi:FAD-binding oxidoreductase [Chelativorans sp. AA-79]|uniref:FAD-binding oxidoreductase n=1 Tax=Chelativorans sp. AA-79 TaxID=3028735 RepID=UPI0023F9A721|nr:FAD-binding oxidoreductase [Chelativorans sp. AA-79]WEX10586.1 FAD-binding oxidoreductase [Chelativorans sp. AA-79]
MTDAVPPAAAQWQAATITAIIPRTARIKSFFFALPRPFTHRPGQYVDLRLTAPDGYSAVRSYSIASAPDNPGEIELAIDRLDDGEVSPFFHDVAEMGDEIELRGPLGGHFVWSVEDGGPLLLVGGGSGLVPLMAMIRHRHSTGSVVPVLLLLSARTWDDVLYRGELLELARLDNGFTLVLSLTRDTPRRDGDYPRRIDAALMSEVVARMPVAPKHVFVCGSNAFVNSAADGALAAGIPAEVIRTERYGA